MSSRKWRKINLGLLAAIVLINLYTIATPFLPSLTYWWKHRDNKAPVPVATYISQPAKITEVSSSDNKPEEPAPLPGNRLIIPRMDMNTEIVEGSDKRPLANLKKGAWRLPFSSTPDKGGNTVIAGHRFTYTESRSIFYYLDKLQIGDEIGIRWDGKLYTYRVISLTTVPPTEVSVQESTNDSRLTLYTCTPVWNPKNRLVVVSELVNNGGN